MKELNLKKGFTIVEVSLVLAIAGLIFLMVFIALPAVQRTQRDAKRRDDVGKLLTELQKFQNNNRGAMPSGSAGGIDWNSQTVKDAKVGDTSWAGFYKSFLGESFEDPTGHYYKLSVGDCGNTTGSECTFGKQVTDNTSFEAANHTMYIISKATCDGSTAVGSGNPRKVAVRYKMEGGGVYCASTQ